jgi:hypothetical protein
MSKSKRAELIKIFKEEITMADWSMLEPHNTRGTLFLVEDFDLIEVAIAIATDNAEMIKELLDSKKIAKPTGEAVDEWSKTPNTQLAQFLVVQPYVLIKLITLN